MKAIIAVILITLSTGAMASKECLYPRTGIIILVEDGMPCPYGSMET
jgi:hypothetical protein